MKIIGRFYFKQTNSGNLIGEFSNNSMSTNSTESADISQRDKEPFTGDYLTTWIQNEEAIFFKLKIQPKTIHNIYKLTWYESDIKNPSFLGEGFIVDEILIGNYQDFKIDEV